MPREILCGYCQARGLKSCQFIGAVSVVIGNKILTPQEIAAEIEVIRATYRLNTFPACQDINYDPNYTDRVSL